MTQMNLSTKQKHIHTYGTDVQLPRGAKRGMEWEVGVSRGKLLYMEWINKVLLYSAENCWCIQYPMINHNGKEYKKGMDIYTYNQITFLYINTTL